MEELIGTNVVVSMKNGKNVSGLLFRLQNNCTYIRSENKIIVIPDNNINFYSTEAEQIHESPTGYGSSNSPKNILKVNINGDHLVDIPVPPNIDLSKASDEVLKIIWSNLDVQDALRGKIQKAMDYNSGIVNIIAGDAIAGTQDAETYDNSFSMEGGKNPAHDYLTPAEMVERLKNVRKKGEKNDQ